MLGAGEPTPPPNIDRTVASPPDSSRIRDADYLSTRVKGVVLILDLDTICG